MSQCLKCRNKLLSNQRCCNICGAWCVINFIQKSNIRKEKMLLKKR